MADPMPSGVTLIEADTNELKAMNALIEDFSESMAEARYLEKEQLELLQKESKKNDKVRKSQEKVLKNEEKAANNPFKKVMEKVDFSKITDTFKEASTTLVDTVLGPLNLIVKPLEEGLNFNLNEVLKKGASGIFKSSGMDAPLGSTENPVDELFEDTILKDDKMNPEKNALLAKGGAMGAAAVYIGSVLKDGQEIAADNNSLLDDLGGMGVDVDLPMSQMTKLAKSIIPAMMVAAPALMGLAAAAIIKREDISLGADQIKQGEFLRGLETILIGDRDADEADAGKNIAKQGLAYGAAGLGVATTAGLATAVSAGGGLAALGVGGTAAAVGPALAAAFPPALIAMGVAATAKGIQVAWVNEWDLRAEEIVSETRAILADDEASWWDKTKAVLGTMGKAFFGGLVGGIKSMLGGFTERFENIKEAIFSDDMSMGKRILTLFKELNIIDAFIISPTIDFFKGFAGVVGSYLKEALPEPILNIFENLGIFISNIYNAAVNKLAKAGDFMKKVWNIVKGFFGDIFDTVKDKVSETFNSVISAITGSEAFQKAMEIVDKIGGFFGDMFDAIGGFISEKFGLAKNGVTSSEWYVRFTEGIDKISNFFGDLFDTIFGWMDNQFDRAKGAVNNTVANVELQREALTLSASRGEKDKVMELIEDQFGGDIQAFNEAFGSSGLDAWNKGLEQLFSGKTGEFNPEALDSLLAARETTVDDAIITNDGQVIHTNPDDNIIATKNEPRFLNQEMSDISSENVDEESVSIMQQQLSALMNLAKILENKSFNNIAVAGGGQGPDFALIRGER